MSLGATASAPASTWLTAVRASSSSVSSFATSPSRRTPQWPCDVYSQRQTSVSSVRPGCLGAQRPERALHDPVVDPRRRSPRRPSPPGSRRGARAAHAERRELRSPRATSSSTERCAIPGSPSTGARSPSPGQAKSGITKSSRRERVSRTSARSASVRRRRRSRVAGKALTGTKVTSVAWPDRRSTSTGDWAASSSSQGSSVDALAEELPDRPRTPPSSAARRGPRRSRTARRRRAGRR